MLLFVLTRKGQVTRHNTCPLRSQSWLRRRESSEGGPLRARASDPAQLSLLKVPGAQDPASPQLPSWQGPRLEDCLMLFSQSRGWGRGLSWETRVRELGAQIKGRGADLGLASGARGNWTPRPCGTTWAGNLRI